MADVMQTLKHDHENIASLLAILTQQLDAVREEKPADFELMHDIMVYMTHYPDSTHHPMEDLMFERLRARGDGTSGIIDALREEHRSLAQKGEQLRETLRLVVDGGMVERSELESVGQDYVRFLAGHMMKENSDVFPVAENLLTEEDWARVETGFADQQDPVFGPVVQSQYQSLFAHIQRHRG